MRIINRYFKILKVKTCCYAVSTRFIPSSLARYMTAEDRFRIKSEIIGSCPPFPHAIKSRRAAAGANHQSPIFIGALRPYVNLS